MDIIFRNSKLQRQCTDPKVMDRTWGRVQTKRLRQRLDELRAASNLEMMRPPAMPGRCHELKGDRAGQLALYLEHPQRLVFEPAHHPAPTKGDGGLDWAAVTAIRVLAIEDYHG